MIGQVAARDLGDGCREDKPEFEGKKMLLRNYETSDSEKLLLYSIKPFTA